MPSFHRLKHSFTAGELSPLMEGRVDFKRFANGSRRMKNAVSLTQGSATNRPGFKFIYSLIRLDCHPTDPRPRLIPFIFSETVSYMMVFFRKADERVRVAFMLNGELLTYEDLPEVGNHDGLDNVAILTDTTATWGIDALVGLTLTNTTDGSAGTITANTATTVTAALTGGTDNDWDISDVYAIDEDGDDGTPCYPYEGVDEGGVVSYTLPVGWDVDKFTYAQSADVMYFAQSGLPPYRVGRYSSKCWIWEQVVIVNPPVEWPAYPAVATTDWPERVSFHQQRLVFAANITNWQTVWMSRSGSFHDFDPAAAADDGAVTFTLDSGTQNKIQWLMSSKEMNIGTVGNEWTVVGGTLNAITPTNILAQKQTNNGSEPIEPLTIGNSTLFVERHGRSVNEFVYAYASESYSNYDISVLAPHLTDTYSISSWAYQQTPHNIVWCVREDGDMIGLTYQREHEVIGWHHHDTYGRFLAVGTIPGNSKEDEVWVVTYRLVGGGTSYGFYIEKLAPFFNSDSSIDGRFMDSYSEYHSEEFATKSISGLDYLQGETVSVLANGSVHPPLVIDETGTATFDDYYTDIVIGLPYETEIRPLTPDVPSQGGTSLGRTQRSTVIDVMLYRSLGMWIGRDDQETGEYEEEVPFRIPSDGTGEAVPLFTGTKHLIMPEGFDRKTEYFIKQKDPLPLTVLAVIDTVEVHE